MFKWIRKWWKLDKPRSLPMRGLGDKPGDFTWEDWQEEAAKAHPIRYAIQERLPIKVYVHVLKPLEELFYWIRTHTYNRYHLLDLRSESNGYKWGYCDPTGMMLYANFAILNMFVENDMPNICYYSEATKHCPVWDKRAEEKEILELHKWWNEERPVETENIDYFHPKLEPEEYATWRCKDDIMLERLVKLRMSLWS